MKISANEKNANSAVATVGRSDAALRGFVIVVCRALLQWAQAPEHDEAATARRAVLMVGSWIADRYPDWITDAYNRHLSKLSKH